MTLDRDDIQAIAETTAPMVARMIAEIMGQKKSQGVEAHKVRTSIRQDLNDALKRKDQRRN